MSSEGRFPTWVLGYSDEWSVSPGQAVTFHVNGVGADTVDAQLVRLIHGDTHPDGPGFREVEVASDAEGTYPLAEHPTQHGSYARLARAKGVLPEAGSSVGLFAMVCPSDTAGTQPLISAWDRARRTGVALVLEPDLRPAFWHGGPDGVQRIATEDGLVAGVWYAVAGSWMWTPERCRS